MGIVTCIAYNCGNRRFPGSLIPFHQFPGKHEPERRRRWEINTKIEGYSAKKDDVLCGLHFTPNSYILGGQSKKLKPDAIPTIFQFPPSSSHVSAITTPRPQPRKRPAPSQDWPEVKAKKPLSNQNNRHQRKRN